jgi:hypothetical protein
LHKARVRRASGFLLTAFSNARPPIVCSAPLSSPRARLRKSTSVTREQAGSLNAGTCITILT